MFYIKTYALVFILLCTEATYLRSGEQIRSKRHNVHFIPPRPDLKQTLALQPDPFTTQDPTTQARVFLKSDLFSENNGKILYYALLVAETSLQEPPENGTWNKNNATEWPNLPNWDSAASDANGTRMYQATPVKWQPFVYVGNESEAVLITSFVLGTAENYGDNYTNGALKSNTEYGLKIRAFTINGYQDTDVIHFKTLEHLPVGTIIIVFSVIFLVTSATMLIGISGKGFLKYMPSCSGFRSKNLLSSPVPTDLSSKNFLKYSRALLNVQSRLSNEYHLLGTLSADATTPCLHGQRTENKCKNRYVNILPFDVTRVELSIVGDDPTSDYINASFIKGFSERIEYIASQGLKEETCHDFWRMVIEQNIELIIMLTNLTENGNEKCFKYFPENGKQLTFEDIKITCVSLEVEEIWDKRTLLIARKMKQITLIHLHFKSWPDFGCPNKLGELVQFCNFVRRIPYSGCIVVHCSAGVGRTGTFIALDILLQSIRNGCKINIFTTVLQLRKQRMNMVQTLSQYEYLYRVVIEFIENNLQKKGTHFINII